MEISIREDHHLMSTAEEESSQNESEEEDEHDEDEENQDGFNQGPVRQAVTGRGVTLAMLMAEGIMEPGEKCMSIEYLGKKFTADLLEDGRIKWNEDNQLFNSPSAWAIHCKKIVNPNKKSGCGWASVKYKGKKLDSYKSIWFRKQKAVQMKLDEGKDSEDSKRSHPEDSDEGDSKRRKIEEEENQDAPLNLSMSGPRTKPDPAKRASVRHSTLGKRHPEHDPNTLVECIPFGALGKIQPFTISFSTNAMLLIDFHCHITSSEVVGYLGGKWDPNSQHLSVQVAFPCQCRLGDKDNASAIEEEIRHSMERRGLVVVGWYHSHPKFQPDPSLRDIDSQMDYQLKLKGEGHSYLPCLGLIVSPYHHKDQKESSMLAYWVMPPPEHRPHEYGMPMSLHFDLAQDMYLTQDLLDDMKQLLEFYKGAPDLVGFKDIWYSSCTYLDKLKASLGKKFPKDQTDGRFLEYIQTLVLG